MYYCHHACMDLMMIGCLAANRTHVQILVLANITTTAKAAKCSSSESPKRVSFFEIKK